MVSSFKLKKIPLPSILHHIQDCCRIGSTFLSFFINICKERKERGRMAELEDKPSAYIYIYIIYLFIFTVK